MPAPVDLHDEGAATATLQWSAVCGDLLRGLTHTLSNRIELLTILSAHLSADTSDIDASVAMLRDECTTFTTLLHLIRLLPYPSLQAVPKAEPLSLSECVEEAVSLLRHNRIGREAELVLSGNSGLPAIWGERMELRRTLLTLLFAALRDAAPPQDGPRKEGGRAGETIELVCRADPQAVTLEIRAPRTTTESQRAFWPTAVYFARAAGAELRSAGDRGDAPVDGKGGSGAQEWRGRGPIELRIPTAAAVRAAPQPGRP